MAFHAFRPMLALATLLLVIFACGCGSDGSATAAPGDKPPHETPMPDPTPTPWPIAGRVFTSMQATCSLGLTGPELSVRYSAQIEGEAEITRVRLVVDSQVREDIDHIAERFYVRETTLSARGNRMVSVELLVETRGAAPTPKTVHLVRCPRPSDLPRT